MEYLTLYVVLTALLIVATTFLMSPSLTRWFKLKKYQYEATFALTMLNPTERFVCNSIVFLTFSMLVIAASLYLPEHIVTMAGRAFYYWSGKTKSSVAQSTAQALGSQAKASASRVAQQAVKVAKESIVNTPVAGPTPVEAVPVQGMGL